MATAKQLWYRSYDGRLLRYCYTERTVNIANEGRWVGFEDRGGLTTAD